MPKTMADKPPNYGFCDKHGRSQTYLFCGKHQVLLCSQCATEQHHNCSVKSVDNIAKDVLSSEIDILYDKVDQLKINLTSTVVDKELNVIEIGKQKEDLLKDTQDLKDKLVDKINKLFKDIKSEIETAYGTVTADLDLGRDIAKETNSRLQCALDDIAKLKGSTVNTKVFLKILEIMQSVDQCKSDVATLNHTPISAKMSFLPDKWIHEFLSSTSKMGSISIDTNQPQVKITFPEILFPSFPRYPITKIKASKLADYSVRIGKADEKCFITAIAITCDGQRLLIDNENRRRKRFSRDMKPGSIYNLPICPWGIAITENGKEVVSCRDEPRLLLIGGVATDQTKQLSFVKLNFIVYGIAPYKAKLIVTCPSTSSSSVKLIDLTGRVYWSTETDQQGQKLFQNPWYVTCYDDGKAAVAIVSDDGNHSLTVLNANTGDVITRRKVDGKSPRGVTTDTVGNIYACYGQTHEVAVLSKDLSQEKILLSQRDGLSTFPQAIVYDASAGQQLLVSNSCYDMSSKVDNFTFQ